MEKRRIEDPIAVTVYPGSHDEPLTETAVKVIALIKAKYSKTNFYHVSSYDGMGIDIKVKLNEVGGMIIEITPQVLKSLQTFASNAYKNCI